MGFYVDLDTDEMADELWASHPARGRNIPPVGNKNCNIGAAVEGAADVAEARNHYPGNGLRQGG